MALDTESKFRRVRRSLFGGYYVYFISFFLTYWILLIDLSRFIVTREESHEKFQIGTSISLFFLR